MKDYTIEIDIPTDPTPIIQHDNFIYKMTTRNVVDQVIDQTTGEVFFYENQNTSLNKNIQSIFVDGVKYPRVTTFNDLNFKEAVFYFDIEEQILYIRFSDSELLLDKVINVGLTTGFSSSGDDSYYNDAPYRKIIAKLPLIRQKTDSLEYNVLKFTPLKFLLANGDGTLDSLAEDDLYGQEMRMYEGDTDNSYNTYDLIYRGAIESFENDFININLTTNDQRKNLSLSLPEVLLTSDSYDIAENRYVPIAYGDIEKAPAICSTDATPATSTHTFYFMDTTYHSATTMYYVYVDGVSVSYSNLSLTEGTFTLTSGQCFDGDNLKEITCSFRGADLDNSIDIIQDLLVNYGGSLYTSDFFDITEWEEARLSTFDVALWVGSSRKIIDCIKDITVSNLGSFFQNTNGNYTFRTSDKTRTPAFTLEKYELINPKFKTSGKKTFTSCLVYYSKNDYADSYNKWLDDSRELELKIKYKTTKLKEVRTLLVNLADAKTVASAFLDFSETQEKTYIIDLELDDKYNCNLYDIVLAPYNRNSDNLGLFEVIEFKNDLEKRIKSLTLKYIEEA